MTPTVTLINFTDLTDKEKLTVLSWRNHPVVKQWMFTQHEISQEEHLCFIENLKSRNDRRYFVVKKEGDALGVVSLSEIDTKAHTAELGIYAAPEQKGVGKLLLETIWTYAKDELKLKTIFAEVLQQNQKAIKLYENTGFQTVSQSDKDGFAINKMELML